MFGLSISGTRNAFHRQNRSRHWVDEKAKNRNVWHKRLGLHLWTWGGRRRSHWRGSVVESWKSGLLLLTGLVRYMAAKFCTVDPLKLVFVGLLLELMWFVILKILNFFHLLLLIWPTVSVNKSLNESINCLLIVILLKKIGHFVFAHWYNARKSR